MTVRHHKLMFTDEVEARLQMPWALDGVGEWKTRGDGWDLAQIIEWVTPGEMAPGFWMLLLAESAMGLEAFVQSVGKEPGKVSFATEGPD